MNKDIKVLMFKHDRYKSVGNFEQYKCFRNIVVNEIRKNKAKFYNSLINNATGNICKIWKVVNDLRGSSKKQQTIKTIKINETLVNNQQEIAEHFADHFSSVGLTLVSQNQNRFTSPFTLSPPFIDYLSDVNDNCFTIPLISPEAFLKYMSQINTNCSKGLDDIEMKFLKTSASVIVNHVCNIINLSFKHGIYPDVWKLSKVVPLFKKGSILDMNNYRPISLLSSLSKVTEKHVHSNLLQYFETNKLLSPNQSGFRPKHSTQTILTKITSHWLQSIDQRKLIGCVTIDLSKAFDLLNIDILLCKLKNYGCDQICINWFRSYLMQRKLKVKIQDCLSSERVISLGVPQGSILGPLIFSIFINDLPLYMKHCYTEMYADDTTIYVIDKNVESIEAKLSIDLKHLESWFNMNHLIVNTSKTNAMLICSSQKRQKLSKTIINVNLFGKSISNVDSIKILGLTIDQNLSWKNHILNLAKTVSGLTGLLYRIRAYLPKDTMLLFYKSCIMSQLDYCLNIWGHAPKSYVDILLKLQKRAIRIITNANYLAPTKNLFLSLKCLNLYDRLEYVSCVLLYKILNGMCLTYLSMFEYNNRKPGLRSATNCNLLQVSVRTEILKNSFLYKSCSIWNKLPTSVKQCDNVFIFKKNLKNYLLTKS